MSAAVIAVAVPLASRRHLLTRLLPAMVLLPAAATAVGACSTGEGADSAELLARLAEAARADAALVAAAVAADPALRTRLDPVAAARTAHAAAVDRLLDRDPGAVPPPAAPAGAAPDLARVQDALAASAAAAAEAVLSLAATEVGLVGSIAACCAAHAETL